MTAMTVTNRGCAHLPPEAGERVQIFDDEIIIKVVGDETENSYALFTLSIAPGGGPPLHAHPGSETVYVLTGEFAFTVRDDGASSFQGGPGTVVHAPAGAPHRFENVGASPATLLIVGAPETIDFLRDAGAAFPAGAEPDLERMLELSAKYNIETIYGGEGARAEPAKDGATSDRARALAWRFGQLNTALIETVESCTAEQWRAVCADTGWTVAVQAHHIAVDYPVIAGIIGTIAAGQPPSPIAAETIDAINARHAEEFAGATQAEVADLLRRNGAEAAAGYRMLTDEQLSRSATVQIGGHEASAEQLLAYLAIGEIENHGEHLRAAMSQ